MRQHFEFGPKAAEVSYALLLHLLLLKVHCFISGTQIEMISRTD